MLADIAAQLATPAASGSPVNIGVGALIALLVLDRSIQLVKAARGRLNGSGHPGGGNGNGNGNGKALRADISGIVEERLEVSIIPILEQQTRILDQVAQNTHELVVIQRERQRGG